MILIRMDLTKTSGGGTAYFRLSKDFVDFLNRLDATGHEIEGVELERKEDGSWGYNIGFLLAKQATVEEAR